MKGNSNNNFGKQASYCEVNLPHENSGLPTCSSNLLNLPSLSKGKILFIAYSYCMLHIINS